MGLYSLVDCCEMHGTANEQTGKEGVTATVQLMCAYADRYALRADLIGNRNLWPHNPVARVVGVGVAPFPGVGITDGQTLTYEKAVLTVNYSSNEEEDLISESIEPTIEFITKSHKNFRWTNATGDPLNEKEAPGQQIFSMALNRTIYKLVPPLPATILTELGKCNTDAYSSSLLGLSFAAETLLFQPTSLSRTLTTDGDRAIDLSMKFLFNSNTWNKFFRAATGVYEEIWNVELAAVEKPYPLGNFSEFLS